MIKSTILSLTAAAALLTAPTLAVPRAQSGISAQVDRDCGASDVACGRAAPSIPASAAAALDPNRLSSGAGPSPAAALGRAIATGATSKAP